MKAKYILIPKNHILAGQRRKVRCKCTDGVNALYVAKVSGKTSHFFNVGKYACKCPDCKSYYFYVE